eukprot:Protomagalhaensia_wolfi_Nauph_80__4186@NODE_4262_length_604_cov_340_950442_g3392_i0_p1_GENE_NODE_4262_length_604_cov_340_950442_g3392_i0NODE_4262_length_604_cov_340_950442_g3392_i0_p1_ORF_typecomplete_len151_score33_55Prefoldin/PF02996_17/2_7e17KASH_CCD/PF14662_6/0_0033Prefoldin_2/PF01920_20/0_028MAD/PF05557_13/0_019_NODE_4262_length_604_cov_340_950442_g3392_i077529
MEKLIVKTDTTSRNIPKAKFFEDISEAFDGKFENIEAVAKTYGELLGKYQLMTASLMEQHKQLKVRLQSLEEGRETVEAAAKRLESGNDTPQTVLFKADDCLYARAEVIDPSKVMLWLGSNTLMEYTPDEAREVLKTNIEATQVNIDKMV